MHARTGVFKMFYRLQVNGGTGPNGITISIPFAFALPWRSVGDSISDISMSSHRMILVVDSIESIDLTDFRAPTLSDEIKDPANQIVRIISKSAVAFA
jgi:hypothetical protein